jgi:hypothetical protein
MRNAFTVGKPEGKIPVGESHRRFRHRWEYNVKIIDWIRIGFSSGLLVNTVTGSSAFLTNGKFVNLSK